jgi:uncharacterized protein
MMRRFSILIVGVVLAAGCVSAQDAKPSRPLVTVYGVGEVKVVPDVVDVSIGVEIRGKDLAAAVEQQAARVAEALALIKKAGVEAKDVQTDFLNVTPVYDDYADRTKTGRTLDYYRVIKDISFSLRDFPKFDKLIAALAQSGINRVQSVRFRSTELSKYRGQAREMAVAAARDKAAAMAAKLGQQIGKAHVIEEMGQPSVNSVSRAALMSNFIAEAESADDEEGDSGLMAGQISVQGRVRVEFELQ